MQAEKTALNWHQNNAILLPLTLSTSLPLLPSFLSLLAVCLSQSLSLSLSTSRFYKRSYFSKRSLRVSTKPRRCTSLLSSRCSCAVANFSRSSWVRSLMALLSSSPQLGIFKLQAHKRKKRFEVQFKKKSEAEPCNPRSHAVSHVLKRNQRGSATRHGPSLVLESSDPSSCMSLVESSKYYHVKVQFCQDLKTEVAEEQ